MTDKADEELQRQAALSTCCQYVGDTADNCVECGLQIPSARQLALPGVQMCVECAELAERGVL